MMLAEVANGLLEGQPAACAGALVEGEVGFIRNGLFGRGVDDGLVESEDGVVVIQQMRRNLLQIRVKPDAEEGFLAADVLDEFVLIHVGVFIISSVFLSENKSLVNRLALPICFCFNERISTTAPKRIKCRKNPSVSLPQ